MARRVHPVPGNGSDPSDPATTPSEDRIHDWTYREAKRRLRLAARSQLPRHTGHVRLDRAGNRIVSCECGWSGNGLGWLTHVDETVNAALRD